MRTFITLSAAAYCAVASAGIYSANDCNMFNARNCWIDEGGIKTVFPKRSPKSICLQDPVWLHEAVLERKLAIQCVNSFPNYFAWTKSGMLINANEFPSPLSIVERVDYRMLYPSGRIKQICNPSKTMDGTASYIATPYSDLSQFAVDKWDSTVFHEQGGFVDAGFVSNKIDRAQMQAWFENIMKARSFTRFGSSGLDKVTYVTLDAPQSQVDIGVSGNVDPTSSAGWYSISQIGYPWWEYESETSFDLKYSWKWNSVERRAGSGKDYTFYNVPPDATVELGVIVECTNWSSYKVDLIKDETRGDLLTYEYYGKQISYTNRIQRFHIVGSKRNYGNTVANLSFSSDEVGIAVARTASFATSMCTGCNPSEGVPEEQARKSINEEGHPAFPCSGYPRKEMGAMFNIYFFPRITLGDHTKWWD